MFLGLTDKRYIGKVCARHPEAGGLRKKSNWICIVCSNENAKAYRKTEQGKQYMQGYLPEYMATNFRDRSDRRRGIIKLQTPIWADQDAIKKVYQEAFSTGKTVDHVVPLRGELVWGLHVDYNLQLLSSGQNSSKGNRF